MRTFKKEKKKDRAITLLELIIVIIIVGILASVTVPMFGKAIEATKANEAVAGLEQIRTGQRIYRVEENSYWGPSIGSEAAEIKNINDKLRTFVDFKDARNWDYDVALNSSMSFTATATRLGGNYPGKTITLDEQGDFNGTWPLHIPQ